MLEAVRQILDFTRGVTYTEYSQNPMLYLAVERAIQIDIHVALAMRSTLGVTAKQVHGSDPELRVLGEIAPQPVEFLFVHDDNAHGTSIPVGA
ncbi:MAG: HepT-like ribonuclease domain-containing protein [Thermoanaerobaculia bacterium]